MVDTTGIRCRILMSFGRQRGGIMALWMARLMASGESSTDVTGPKMWIRFSASVSNSKAALQLRP